MEKRPTRPGSPPAGAPKPKPTKKPAASTRLASAADAEALADTGLTGRSPAETDPESEEALAEQKSTRAPVGGKTQGPAKTGKSSPPAAQKSQVGTPTTGKTSAGAKPGVGAKTQGGGSTGKTSPGNKSAAPEGGQKSNPPEGTSQSGAGEAGGKVNIIGDYKLIKKLGAGGMGSVFKAWQISLEREVALKLLSRELAGKPAFVERFKREARVMARLDHPNILRCFDVGQSSGYHYLSMEFVDGGSLEGWLKKLGKFTIEDAVHIVIACARGLEHAHNNTLIHRDIKPDNILLTNKGVVKVADLGLAKATDEDMSLTKTGTGAGTPIYMAPEQARDVKRVDGRADIYALGCMLYCLLTGQPPFKGETLVELIDAKTKGKFTPSRQLNPEIPSRLDLIIDKMVQTKPEHRFQTCAEVVAALEELGVASDRLSFLGGAAPEGSGKKSEPPSSAAPSKAPTNRTRMNSTASGGTRVNSPEEEAPKTADGWYVKLVIKGKPLTKRVTRGQLDGLITSSSIGPDTLISQNYSSGFRPLGTWKQFEHQVKARQVKTKADKGGEKYRDLYKQIAKQDERRQRWKWLGNLLGAGGGLIGGCIRFILIVVLGLSLFFGGWMLFNYVGGGMGRLM